jgi:hypothetical protein
MQNYFMIFSQNPENPVLEADKNIIIFLSSYLWMQYNVSEISSGFQHMKETNVALILRFGCKEEQQRISTELSEGEKVHMILQKTF